MVNISSMVPIVFMNGEDKFISKNFGWVLVNASSSFAVKDGPVPDFKYYTFDLFLTLDRRPDYYVTPCIFLILIEQDSSFILTPGNQHYFTLHDSDFRPAGNDHTSSRRWRKSNVRIHRANIIFKHIAFLYYVTVLRSPFCCLL